MVFSFPSIIKYPPKSFLHSPILYFTIGSRLFNIHKLELSIIGNLPKNIFSSVVDVEIVSSPSVIKYSIKTS